MDQIVKEVIDQLKAQLQSHRQSVSHAVTASREAPSRMEARYDSRKEDMANLANAQDEIVAQYEQLIIELETTVNQPVFDGKGGYYLLVSKYGGKSFQTSAGKVTLVSIESPLGQKLAQS
ncbi:hypothetical protein M1403_04030 [Patescibacteria group bacterium]|nr:hypothetical protein [Patescibacteria group bacterium]